MCPHSNIPPAISARDARARNRAAKNKYDFNLYYLPEIVRMTDPSFFAVANLQFPLLSWPPILLLPSPRMLLIALPEDIVACVAERSTRAAAVFPASSASKPVSDAHLRVR